MSITKSDLAHAIAETAQLSRRKSAKATSTIIESMMTGLASGDTVRISGFGKFHVKTLSARSGRHPRSGKKIAIASRLSVGFKCFKGLKSRINRIAKEPDPSVAAPERRSEIRRQDFPKGRAQVRISGIPVCDFPIKDVSGNGSCILVEAQSVIMRNIHIGQEIEIHFPGPAGSDKSILQRSKITHITQQGDQDEYPGYVLVGVNVIDRIAS